ncbi:hypothetical protein [Microbispora sp. H10949]|uniref:hypothetical protein n=1 Tax=Microbispora sp. H10949 TaxID=2729111 RepID=UPI00160166F9|nr:hypothetical protein [Microbispora sp. H10949]
MAKNLSEGHKQQIRQKVADDLAGDGVHPDEVDVRDDGEIVLDRRKTIPWAKPVAIGRWK